VIAAQGDGACDAGDVTTPMNDGEEPTLNGESSNAASASGVAADIDRVLDPIRPFLASKILADVEARLRPIVDAAHKPSVVVTVEAQRPLASGEAPRAKRVGKSTLGKLFGAAGAHRGYGVALWDAVDAPKPDQAYVVDPTRFIESVTALEHGENVWLAGAAGTGKSTLAREYAARTGRPFVRIGFTRSTEILDLIGQDEPTPEGASVKMVWRDKVFVQAIRRPGTVILLDELTFAPAGTVAVFQTMLDERRVTLPTGEAVNFADGVVCVIGDNTAGYGDESGVYAGTQSANAALIDRCARLVVVEYLPVALEALALAKRTLAPAPACERLAGFASTVRLTQAQSGDARPFSFRRLVAFLSAVHRDKLNLDTAWRVTVLSRLPEADRETMRQAIRAHFDGAAFMRELQGGNDEGQSDAPLSQAPEQIGARSAFAPQD
jgi:MoxR-like ATPase